MRYLLDTNTCIGAMRNDPAIVGRMSAVAPGDCAISTITSYELYTGIAKCSDRPRERAKVTLLLKMVHTLPFDAAAAAEAARIRGELESQNTRFPNRGPQAGYAPGFLRARRNGNAPRPGAWLDPCPAGTIT